MKLSRHQLITDLLQQEKLAVIATTSKQGTPQTALIAFAEDDEFCLYFQTGQRTRKAQSLKHNAVVSLSIGLNVKTKTTIQYEGRAMQIIKPSAIEACKQKFLAKKSPTTKQYLERPDTIFFKITPTWLRLTDYSHMPSHPTVFKITFKTL